MKFNNSIFSSLISVFLHKYHSYVFCRFVEYWARIGSEDNMTMCHRPTCRKEGVLLDYSTDGGANNSTAAFSFLLF